jgi:hypothetical protein
MSVHSGDAVRLVSAAAAASLATAHKKSSFLLGVGQSLRLRPKNQPGQSTNEQERERWMQVQYYRQYTLYSLYLL